MARAATCVAIFIACAVVAGIGSDDGGEIGEPDVLADCVYDEEAIANGTMYVLLVSVCVSTGDAVNPSPHTRQCTVSTRGTEVSVTLDGVKAALQVSCGATAMFVYAAESGARQLLFVFVLGSSMFRVGSTGTRVQGVGYGTHRDTLLLLQDLMSCTEALKISVECVYLDARNNAAGVACVRSVNTRTTYVRVSDKQSLSTIGADSPWRYTGCDAPDNLLTCR